MFEDHAAKQPDKTFIIFEDKHYSYGYVEKQANKLGNALCGLGIMAGDTVAILNHNDLNFIITYLGTGGLNLTKPLVQKQVPLPNLYTSFQLWQS